RGARPGEGVPVIGPIVMKFGGTSVADAGRLRGVAALAAERAVSGVLLVLSAFSGVTDGLFEAGRAAAAGNEAAALALLGEMIERHRLVASELLDLPKRALPMEVEAALAAAESDLGAVLIGAALLRALPERSLDILAG